MIMQSSFRHLNSARCNLCFTFRKLTKSAVDKFGCSAYNERVIEAVSALFKGNESSLAIWDRLSEAFSSLGLYSIEEKKTCLHVSANGRAFLGVHPRKNGVKLTIPLTRQLEESRVKKTERASANRWHNDVDVTSPEQVDAELISWIAEAYSRP